MAGRAVKKLIEEKREAQKILASLGALLDGFSGGTCAPEPSLQNLGTDNLGKDNDDANQGKQERSRGRGGNSGRDSGI